ncbi:MAG: beta-lactamase family protein [Thermomicrobiales bacterium]|nr:beta-lactamase family protein [Thermomicrobiales bacterium]
MQRRQIFRFLGVLSLVVALLIPLATPAAAQGGSETYTEPEGRFSFPVPSGWTVDEQDGFVLLADPDGDITFAMLVTEAADARAGIAAAWDIVEPEFDLEPLPGSDQDLPAQGEIDEIVVLTYDIGQSTGQVVQAIGQRVGDQNYVMIIGGSLDAAARRNSQIQLIAAGFVFGDEETTDYSQAEAAPFEGELVDAFSTFAGELFERSGVPGVSIAVVQNGEIVYAQGLGVTVAGGSQPVTPDTLMMIGSVSKSFTTTMMASMVDQGLFDWDTPVVDVLPGFQFSDPELTAQITMRNLVCACTGVPRRDLELIFSANELTAEEIITSLAGFEVFTDFGEAFQYSNQMVAVAGYVAAHAAGGVYGDLDDAYTQELQRRVLDPLGMERTTLSFINASLDPDVASPHSHPPEEDFQPLGLDTEALLEPVKPAGTLWSTANELGSYLIMQLNDGVAPSGVVVASPDNLLQTREPQIEITTTISYGLGWTVEDRNGLQVISHGGNTMGFTSYLSFLPGADLGLAVLINGQAANGFGEALEARLLELVLGLPEAIEGQLDQGMPGDGTPEAEASPVAVASTMAIAPEPTFFGERPTEEEVADLLGSYTEASLGDVTISWSIDDGLVFDAGEFTAELRPTTGDAAAFGDWIMIDGPIAGTPFTVETSDDGEPALVLNGGSDIYRFVRVEDEPV